MACSLVCSSEMIIKGLYVFQGNFRSKWGGGGVIRLCLCLQTYKHIDWGNCHQYVWVEPYCVLTLSGCGGGGGGGYDPPNPTIFFSILCLLCIVRKKFFQNISLKKDILYCFLWAHKPVPWTLGIQSPEHGKRTVAHRPMTPGTATDPPYHWCVAPCNNNIMCSAL